MADSPVVEEWFGGLVDSTERNNNANPRTNTGPAGGCGTYDERRPTVADPEGQVYMYIGLGTLVVILVIVAIIYLVRRA